MFDSMIASRCVLWPRAAELLAAVTRPFFARVALVCNSEATESYYPIWNSQPSKDEIEFV